MPGKRFLHRLQATSMRYSHLRSTMDGCISFMEDTLLERTVNAMKRPSNPSVLTKLEQWTKALKMKFDRSRYKT